MKQKLFIDIRLYDEQMQTIYNQNHRTAERAIKEATIIMNKKIKGV